MDTPDTQTQTNAQGPSVEEALQRLQQQVVELGAYTSQLVSAKLDQLKLSGRNAVLWTVVGGLGTLVLITMIVVAVVLLLIGCATGLGMVLDGNLWLGQIIVGLGLLGMLVVAVLIGSRRIQRQARIQKVQHYAERQRQQRAQFGHSATDLANDAGVR